MSRALVLCQPIEREGFAPSACGRADAGFIAHLIAGKVHVPQARVRRRAEPVEAIAAYAALGHWPIPAGRVLARSL